MLRIVHNRSQCDTTKHNKAKDGFQLHLKCNGKLKHGQKCSNKTEIKIISQVGCTVVLYRSMSAPLVAQGLQIILWHLSTLLKESVDAEN